MDPQITAALIGAGATLVAAAITIWLTRRRPAELPATSPSRRRRSQPAPREPSALAAKLSYGWHYFLDDPMSALVQAAIYLFTAGLVVFILFTTGKALFKSLWRV